MSPWSTFPFVRLTLALMSGILTATYYTSYAGLVTLLLGCLVISYGALVVGIPCEKYHAWSHRIGLLGLSSLFCIGYLVTWMQHIDHRPNHLVHWADTITAYTANVIAVDEQENRTVLTVEVKTAYIQDQWQVIQGKVRLYLPRQTPFRPGHVLVILGAPQVIPAPRNPDTFHYPRKGHYAMIYHQQRIHPNQAVILHTVLPHYGLVQLRRLYNVCHTGLTQHLKGKPERAIVLALLLGSKDELSPMLKEAYACTGTMHVLAVSGLHVGILYGLVGFLLSWFRIRGWGKRVVTYLVLWGYALLTGLAPPVMRATTMFTFFLLAQRLGKQNNPYNSLAATAFIFLLINPYVVFSVSFQLSYLAVLGILYLQPKLYAGVRFRNRFVDQFWQLSTVSLAAQLATTPISLYYFHQWPIYALFCNWLVIPAASLIVWLGAATLLTSRWPVVSSRIARVLEYIVLQMNQGVSQAQHLPGSTLYCPIDLTTLLLLYGVFLACRIGWRKKAYGWVAHALILLLSVSTLYTYSHQKKQKKLIFYSIPHHCVVAFIQGHKSTLCFDSTFLASPHLYTQQVKPSLLKQGDTTPTRCTFEEAAANPHFPLQTYPGFTIVVWQGKSILFIDQPLPPYPLSNVKLRIDILVVEGNAVVHLDSLMARFNWTTLLIGASNSPWVAEKLHKAAQTHHIASYLLHQGAYTVSW